MQKLVTDGKYWTEIFEGTHGSQRLIRTNDLGKAA